MYMYKKEKVEKEFLSVISTAHNIRIDKEKFNDLSLSEIWTGLTMKRDTRKLYDSFVEAAVTERFKQEQAEAASKGKPFNWELAKITRYLKAKPAL